MSKGQHGGKRKGAGRKPKPVDEKAKERLLKAAKAIYNTEDDEESIIKFLEDFVKTRDGMKFFAEHIIGKAPDEINHTNDGGKFESEQVVIKFGKKKNY